MVEEGKKKIAIIGVSSLILVAMVVAVATGVNHADKGSAGSPSGSSGQISTSTKSIQAICQPVDYRETCESSLSRAAGNTSNPNQLVQAGLQATIDALKVAIGNSSTIKEAENDPRAKKALDNCKIMMNMAIEDLKASFYQVGEFDVTKLNNYAENLKIWLSGTITYQQTCIELFDNTTGETGAKMREILRTSSMLSTNGLSMVTELTSILKDLKIPETKTRKLLNVDEMPEWVSPSKRALLQAAPAAIKADIVVAQDGTGKYKTITEAVKQVPQNSSKAFVIHVKAGVYNEKVEINRNMTNVVLLGDGPKKTVVTGNLSFTQGLTTLDTATVSISGAHFIAKDIGFENTAGALGHQAVALLVQSDMSVFYNCHIDGNQNTLYAHTYRQFYRDCKISGTLDMIAGDSASVFQNCHLVIRKPIDLQKCTITAQQRNNTKEPTGFVIQNSTIVADKDYLTVKETNPAFLGRPQEPFSRTIFMQTEISDAIDPKGWAPFMGTFGTETCFFAEFENKGPGADTSKRVTWKGVKKITAEDAAGFTAGTFIQGDSWIKAAGVPYVAGMN